MERGPVITATDNYLDFHGHSPEAYETVAGVLTKFDHMVTLATQRALESLELPPDNVIYLDSRRRTRN